MIIREMDMNNNIPTPPPLSSPMKGEEMIEWSSPMNERIGDMIKFPVGKFIVSPEFLIRGLLCLVFILFTANAYASGGASFLKIPVGARASGMGNAYTAVANDVSALFWNPAGLARINRKEVSVMHTELFADTNYDFIGYAHPLKRGSFGVGVVYLSQGSLEGRGEDRGVRPDFTASDIAVTLGMARLNLSLPITVGANLKVLQSKIEGLSSTGFAFDLGLNHDSSIQIFHMPLNLGFAVRNIGPKMRFIEEGFNLPLTLSAGAALELTRSHFPLTLSADVQHQPYDSRTTLSLGGEFTPISLLSLRAGYLTNAIRTSGSEGNDFKDKISNLSGLGMGLGIRIGPGTMDYSFTPAGELGNSQRFSLSIKF